MFCILWFAQLGAAYKANYYSTIFRHHIVTSTCHNFEKISFNSIFVLLSLNISFAALFCILPDGRWVVSRPSVQVEFLIKLESRDCRDFNHFEFCICSWWKVDILSSTIDILSSILNYWYPYPQFSSIDILNFQLLISLTSILNYWCPYPQFSTIILILIPQLLRGCIAKSTNYLRIRALTFWLQKYLWDLN